MIWEVQIKDGDVSLYILRLSLLSVNRTIYIYFEELRFKVCCPFFFYLNQFLQILKQVLREMYVCLILLAIWH